MSKLLCWSVGGSSIPAWHLTPVRAVRSRVSFKDVFVIRREGFFAFLFVTSVLIALSLGFCDLGVRADPSLGERRALDSWPR